MLEYLIDTLHLVVHLPTLAPTGAGAQTPYILVIPTSPASGRTAFAALFLVSLIVPALAAAQSSGASQPVSSGVPSPVYENGGDRMGPRRGGRTAGRFLQRET